MSRTPLPFWIETLTKRIFCDATANANSVVNVSDASMPVGADMMGVVGQVVKLDES